LPGSQGRYVFLSLLPDPGSEQALELLTAALDPDSGSSVVEAPVRGRAFLAARGYVARELDAWWERSVPGDMRPVILVMDEPGLEAHLDVLDCDLVVGVAAEADRARYAPFPHAGPIVTTSPLVLVEHTIAAYPCFREPVPAAPPAPPEVVAHEAMPAAVFMPRSRSETPARLTPPPPLERSLTATLPDPFTELSALPPLGTSMDRLRFEELSRASLFAGGTGTPATTSRNGPRLGIVRRLFARRRTISIPREIGDLVLGLHPAPLVVVPARKGGVGKTVTAGAVAQVIGYALGDTTGSAAIVDQNIGNPDQWGRMDVPPTAGTVRQLMAALSSGLDLPPTPAWAKTPALAVYPEDRGAADAYPPGLIHRFVQHLRERHVFLVVDLPNRLPDYTTAEAAICAAYLELADLVILPTTDDPNALLGVLEYLETPSMRGKLVVVSYIVSTDRQLRRHRVVTDLLDEIRRKVIAIETVPKSEKATLAIVKGMSILDISPKLRDAYIRVAQTAVRALATAG
jgi:cellulose biosynthesis protein BcsQ